MQMLSQYFVEFHATIAIKHGFSALNFAWYLRKCWKTEAKGLGFQHLLMDLWVWSINNTYTYSESVWDSPRQLPSSCGIQSSGISFSADSKKLNRVLVHFQMISFIANKTIHDLILYYTICFTNNLLALFLFHLLTLLH